MPTVYMGENPSNHLQKQLDFALVGLYRLVPGTYFNLFRSAFGHYITSTSPFTVLDVGCGDGSTMSSLGLSATSQITGLDIFPKYLHMAEAKRIYNHLIRANALTYKFSHSYDVVVSAHILEHFSKSQGYKFLKKIESAASSRVIVACPIGYLPQSEYDHNPHQEHKSAWTVADMRSLGYVVRAQGFRPLWGDTNVVTKYGLLSYLLFLISYLLQPLLLIKPELGTYMICYKNVTK